MVQYFVGRVLKSTNFMVGKLTDQVLIAISVRVPFT